MKNTVRDPLVTVLIFISLWFSYIEVLRSSIDDSRYCLCIQNQIQVSKVHLYKYETIIDLYQINYFKNRHDRLKPKENLYWERVLANPSVPGAVRPKSEWTKVRTFLNNKNTENIITLSNNT